MNTQSLRPRVLIVAGLLASRVLPIPIVQVARGEKATPEAAAQAPSAYPLYKRGASPLHEGGNASSVKWADSNCLFTLQTQGDDEAEEWFGIYMNYKRHEETIITWLLQQHFPVKFHRSRPLVTTLPDWGGEREEETASERSCPRVARPQQFEYLSNQLALGGKKQQSRGIAPQSAGNRKTLGSL